MTEFSRRVDVHVFRDTPFTLEEYSIAYPSRQPDLNYELAHRSYLDNFQPYRWHARAANGEIIARGEAYFNEADCLNAVQLLCGDDTTTYWMPMFGEDRAEHLLRYGVTDRNAQGDDSPEQAETD